MGLFERIGDILSANLNDMVEKFEDPERMLKQAIREMESAVALARQETARAMADARLVRRSLAEQEGEAREWRGGAERAGGGRAGRPQGAAGQVSAARTAGPPTPPPEIASMFFLVPFRVSTRDGAGPPPLANSVLIAANVVVYLLNAWRPLDLAVGPGSSVVSV